MVVKSSTKLLFDGSYRTPSYTISFKTESPGISLQSSHTNMLENMATRSLILHYQYLKKIYKVLQLLNFSDAVSIREAKIIVRDRPVEMKRT